MKNQNFLNKLKRERKIELVEPSEEMKLSYLQKAENCLKSARILFKNQLYENSVSEAYYCIYNSLLSFLFKVGIKSENHSASIFLFDELFDEKELVKIALSAKEERIDKQYYVESQQIVKVNQDSCAKMISNAEDFLIRMKVLIGEINNDDVIRIRNSFEKLFELDF